MTKKHLHILKRIGKRSASFYQNRYRCIDPECTFKERAELLDGKRVVCALCLHPEGYIIRRDQLFNTTPRCLECSSAHKAKKISEIATDLEHMFDAMSIDPFKERGDQE